LTVLKLKTRYYKDKCIEVVAIANNSSVGEEPKIILSEGLTKELLGRHHR